MFAESYNWQIVRENQTVLSAVFAKQEVKVI